MVAVGVQLIAAGADNSRTGCARNPSPVVPEHLIRRKPQDRCVVGLGVITDKIRGGGTDASHSRTRFLGSYRSLSGAESRFIRISPERWDPDLDGVSVNIASWLALRQQVRRGGCSGPDSAMIKLFDGRISLRMGALDLRR